MNREVYIYIRRGENLDFWFLLLVKLKILLTDRYIYHFYVSLSFFFDVESFFVLVFEFLFGHFNGCSFEFCFMLSFFLLASKFPDFVLN